MKLDHVFFKEAEEVAAKIPGLLDQVSPTAFANSPLGQFVRRSLGTAELTEAELLKITNQFVQKKPGQVGDANMSASTFVEYVKNLAIPRHELDTPGNWVLDLGSGAQQELAKSARLLGLRSNVISMSPRLGLPLSKDLALEHSVSDEYLRVGRTHPEPFTIAGIGANLPLDSGSMNTVLGHFSIPLHLNASELRTTFGEVRRVLPSG